MNIENLSKANGWCMCVCVFVISDNNNKEKLQT